LVAGACVVVLGTLVPWGHLYSHNIEAVQVDSGFKNVYQLADSHANAWTNFAGWTILAGSILMAIAGVLALAHDRTRGLQPGLMLTGFAGSAIVLAASISTGLPRWPRLNAGFMTAGPGRWICVAGAVIGLFGASLLAFARESG
jgi:hypothetical protein